jgi:2-C-methyl-D-erythritol 4-phosphate cytidylyltransferase
MKENNKYAVIVAGGSGSRMKSDIPKQFLELNGKPIIIHTIEKFLKVSCKIIVVLPANQFDKWDELKSKYLFLNDLIIAEGGSTRFESVKNGLDKITEDGTVAIHDAVRPMISVNKINEIFDFATQHGNASAALPCVDTIRFEKENHQFEIIDRNKVWLMQTPQCFKINKLKEAYKNAEHINYTDDVAVFEASGNKIYLIEGEKSNIKITIPEDLKLAEFYLRID